MTQHLCFCFFPFSFNNFVVTFTLKTHAVTASTELVFKSSDKKQVHNRPIIYVSVTKERGNLLRECIPVTGNQFGLGLRGSCSWGGKIYTQISLSQNSWLALWHSSAMSSPTLAYPIPYVELVPWFLMAHCLESFLECLTTHKALNRLGSCLSK